MNLIPLPLFPVLFLACFIVTVGLYAVGMGLSYLRWNGKLFYRENDNDVIIIIVHTLVQISFHCPNSSLERTISYDMLFGPSLI